MAEKKKIYTLYAKIPGTAHQNYTIEDALKDETKRGLALFSGEQIEELDYITKNYDSLDDFLESYMEEYYGEKLRLYAPVIIVDKFKDNKKDTYAIYEFVFKDEYKELQDIKKIRDDVESYLIANPDELRVSMKPYRNIHNQFRGLCNISTNIKKKHPNIGDRDLITYTLNEYFKNDNAKRYREAYFTLKRIYPEREMKNGIHR